MNKKLAIVTTFIFLFFGIANAWAALFNDVLLLNDTSEDGWGIWGDVTKTDGSAGGGIVTIDLLGTTTALTIEDTEAYGQLPINPNPAAANGEMVKFTNGDSVLSLRIASATSPEGKDGIIEIPASYNFQVTTNGTNPIIAWTNDFNTKFPEYAPVDQYVVRVYDEGWKKLVSHRIKSSEVDLTGADRIFDFSTIDFSFERNKSYTIRIETRKYSSLYDENDQVINKNDFGGYIGVINRNKAHLSYYLPNLLTQTQVSQLYVSIFGRASEGEGNAYWSANQDDMTVAAEAMLNTDPAKVYFGDKLNDNQQFIEFIYENTLGKTFAEDPEGVNYWVKKLEEGDSKAKVIVDLINAAMDPQYAGLPSQDQFINKVTVCNYTADTIATCPDVNDLSAFVGFISGVTDASDTVTVAKSAVNAF